MPHRARKPLAAAASLALLAACATNEPDIVPPDLDDTSAAAPRCGGQVYPFNALENFERGVVVVLAQVAAGGQVTRTEIASPTQSDYLNQAALIGTRYCRFAPAAEPRRVRITAVFDLVGRGDKLPVGRVRIGIQPSLQQDLKPA